MPNYTTITGFTNHGTIIAVHLKSGPSVYFDHRPFGHMVEARGGLQNILGQRARRVDTGEVETIEFEDEEGLE